MLDGGSTQRLYKTITVWDDDLVNPWRSVYLKLKSDDYRVIVPYNYTHAILWIEDNEGIILKFITLLSRDDYDMLYACTLIKNDDGQVSLVPSMTLCNTTLE